MRYIVPGSGLPHRKSDTYDLFELEKYDHSAYNSVLYLLALKVMSKMAQLKNDQEMLDDVNSALQRAQKLFDVEMWDQRRGIDILFSSGIGVIPFKHSQLLTYLQVHFLSSPLSPKF